MGCAACKSVVEARRRGAGVESADEADFFEFAHKGYLCAGHRAPALGNWEAGVVVPAKHKFRLWLPSGIAAAQARSRVPQDLRIATHRLTAWMSSVDGTPWFAHRPPENAYWLTTAYLPGPQGWRGLDVDHESVYVTEAQVVNDMYDLVDRLEFADKYASWSPARRWLWRKWRAALPWAVSRF